MNRRPYYYCIMYDNNILPCFAVVWRNNNWCFVSNPITVTSNLFFSSSAFAHVISYFSFPPNTKIVLLKLNRLQCSGGFFFKIVIISRPKFYSVLRITVVHTTRKYPTKLSDVNLNVPSGCQSITKRGLVKICFLYNYLLEEVFFFCSINSITKHLQQFE